METRLLTLAQSAMKKTQDWLMGQTYDLRPVVILQRPDETLEQFTVDLGNYSDDKREGEVIRFQGLCREVKATGAVTVETRWAVSPGVDRSTFLEELRKHRHIEKIPGYTEFLVITTFLPDRPGPALLCKVQRNELHEVTGFGALGRVNDPQKPILAPWSTVPRPEGNHHDALN
jgi:hypothetical protein